MNTSAMMKESEESSPRFRARLAGVFYLLTIVTGALAVVFGNRDLVRYADISNLAATACYVVVTLLFYGIFKPVSKTVSLLAALVSLVGCALGALGSFHLAPTHFNNLVVFGGYCLLIGYLTFRSTFLPRILGLLMALGGLGWLTFLSPQLAHRLSPFNVVPALIGETSLTLWLLIVGLNVERWKARAGTARESQPAG